MLKIPKSVEYALLALKVIAENDNGSPVSVKKISETQNIPFGLLAKILQKLVKNSIIESQQGKMGGYSLSSNPNQISIAKISSILGHKIKLTECMTENPNDKDCARVNTCCLRDPIVKLQSKVTHLFEATTLSEIIN